MSRNPSPSRLKARLTTRIAVPGMAAMVPLVSTNSRADESIDLTAREFALLEYLMRQRGNVVTKQQIMANVWNFDFEGDSNIVEVYVGRLRRKIDKPFGREDIETLRGTGYRMRLER